MWVKKKMNSLAITLPAPPLGRPVGGSEVHRNGGLGALAPINVFTGIQVPHIDQRRACFFHPAHFPDVRSIVRRFGIFHDKILSTVTGNLV